MTFYTNVIAQLGRLFTDISVEISKGGAHAALAMIRNSFASDLALLSIEGRNRGQTPERYIAQSEGFDAALAQGMLTAKTLQTPRGFDGITAYYLDDESGQRYQLRLLRAQEKAAFGADDQSLAEHLLAHLARNLQSSASRLSADLERSLYSETLDRLQVGVIILDRAGRILSASGRAQDILTARAGLQVMQDRLIATKSNEDKQLQDIIRWALSAKPSLAEGQSQALSLTKPKGGQRFSLIVRPLRGQAEAAVAISLRDAEGAIEMQAPRMRQIFDLTPAEAAVTNRLTAGLSLEDAANALSISRNTARAHLRSIFMKNGISRQTELVRLVLNSAVLFGEVKSTSAAR